MSVESSPMYPLGTGVFGLDADIKPVTWVAAAGTSTMVPRADHQHAGVALTATKFFPPIGAVLPWAKTLAGTPALPAGWQECDGGVINNALSPMNGQNTPNINGTPRFVRGNTTSGTTGGEDTHALTTEELAAHTHTYVKNVSGVSSGPDSSGSGTTWGDQSTASGSTGSGTAHENRPAYIEMVYIIRIY